MIRKLKQVLHAEGVTGVVRRGFAFAYRRGIRPLLPAVGPARYAGIPVAYEMKLGDRVVPGTWRPGTAADIPDYEAALVRIHEEGRIR